ncbi:MAG: hypothetical protein AAF490_08295 [Chloroflexota bacterium]
MTVTSVPTKTAVSTETPLPTKTPAALSQLEPFELDPQWNAEQKNAAAVMATEQLERWLQEAWQLNISVETISHQLIEADWQREEGEITAVDIDGDGLEEWLMTFYLQPQGALFTRAGDFWIIGQDGIEFRFYQPENYYNDGPRDFFLNAPRVLFKADFTQSGLEDLLIEQIGCGAHTCWWEYHLYTVQDYAYRTVAKTVDDSSLWGSTLAFYHQPDQDYISMTYVDDAILLETETGVSFQISGGWAGSAGSGIQRIRTETWGWTGSAFEMVDLEWHPSDLQMHILREANDFYEMGMLDDAGNLYQRLFNDPTLTNYGGEPSSFEDEEFRRVIHFAIFKLMTIGYQIEDAQLIETWRNWLFNNAPDSNYIQIAELLWEQYQAGAPLVEACEIVNTAVSTLPLEAEMPIEYGYANPQVTTEQLCVVIE